ncbi:MAG: ATP-binding cassette domain-containing protein [Pseudomonadota bacterium]|nr:ATP-binding cassette domain-containing protein [Pseudomonadota bacterium]
MPVLTLEGACLAFGHHALLDHADLVVEAGDRIALIGRNGTGKSSLVKAFAGELHLDDGKVWKQPGLRVAHVPQEPPYDPAGTVYETVASGLGALREALVGYHRLSAQMASEGHASDADLARLAEFQHALDSGDGWTQHSRIEAVIDQMALPPDRTMGELSGGWRKRVALARAWVGDPELLLLDEPTNHLDIEAIEDLEAQLIAFRGAILFVTHDRRFMDRVANRIIELDRGRLGEFGRSWADYELRKADQLAREAVENAKADKFLAQEEVWIRKGVEARRTRSVGRVQRLDRLRAQRAARRERLSGVRLALDTGDQGGELVAELNDVTIQVPGRTLVAHFSTRILRGDCIGLIGANGAGKTSFLRVLLGEQPPSSGRVRLGTRLQIAYFDQMRAQLDPEATLIDTISPGSDTVEIRGQRKHVLSYLGDFLFPPERARAKVKSLSGGERNRLLLARLFARPANLLVLDEPTNDLDVETLELLEELLADYPGTLLLVSHDRAFLDNVVTQVIALDGQGGVVENAGGYEDFRRWRDSADGRAYRARLLEVAAAAAAEPGDTVSPAPPPATPVPEKALAPAPAERKGSDATARLKLSYKEQRELEALPGRIEALEREQGEVAAALARPETWQGDPGEVQRLSARAAAIDGELLAAMERWDELDNRQREAAGG